jgi:hypothetical protein
MLCSRVDETLVNNESTCKGRRVYIFGWSHANYDCFGARIPNPTQFLVGAESGARGAAEGAEDSALFSALSIHNSRWTWFLVHSLIRVFIPLH